VEALLGDLLAVVVLLHMVSHAPPIVILQEEEVSAVTEGAVSRNFHRNIFKK
jgi:hypothetical protein